MPYATTFLPNSPRKLTAMDFTITDKLQTINGKEYSLSAVNNLTRIKINNRLHYLGDQILKLRMQQDELIKMRDELDTQPIDLFHEMFETT
jgi:hypothetical protein